MFICTNQYLRISKLIREIGRISLCCLCLSSSVLANQEVEFDTRFLQGNQNQEKADLTRFNYNAPPAGEYIADVYLNKRFVGQVNTVFAEDSQQSTVLCATNSLLSALDLVDNIQNNLEQNSTQCIPFNVAIPLAKTHFDLSSLKLDIELPQGLIKQHPSGYISPSRWQTGDPVAFVRYDASHYRYRFGSFSTNQSYLSVDAGVNLFGWALRHRGNKSWIPGIKTSYQNIATYLQHDVPSLRAQFKIGDFYTSGELMDSLSIRGVQLSSDDRMLASSLRGYAPIIRGVANSNAHVIIRQRNTILRELSVPAGPFEINDLTPLGYSGDIEVEIQEANGQKRFFKIPYTAGAQLIRPGFARYNVSMGRYRDMDKVYRTKVAQATLQYGLTNGLTLNLGASYAKNYHAELAGLAFSTPIGDFSANATLSHANIANTTYRGYSLSANYNTHITSTNTALALAAYRYSSRNYYRLFDVIYANEGYPVFKAYNALNVPIAYRPKNQFQITASQPFKEGWGSLYLTGSRYTYWATKKNQTEFQIGYSNAYRNINYSISLSHTKNIWGEKNTTAYLHLSIPLGKDNSTYLSQNMTHDQFNGFTSNTALSGNLGKDGRFGYNLYVNKSKEATSWGASGNYHSNIANVQGTWSRAQNNYQQLSFNVSGAIVAHAKGITLSNSLGDTFAIVHAKGARGASISGSSGDTLDYFGNGIVPYLTPYAVNTVSISTEHMDDTVALSGTTQEVIPRANSAILVSFESKTGNVVFFELSDISPLPPIGTEVFNEQQQSIGMVAQGGRIYTRGLPNQGTLTLSWQDKQCTFHYTLPDSKPTNGRPLIIPVQCQH